MSVKFAERVNEEVIPYSHENAPFLEVHDNTNIDTLYVVFEPVPLFSKWIYF